MKKNDSKDEPRDEFDHVMLPAFMAKPLGFFQNSSGIGVPPRPAAQPSRRDGNPNSGNPFSSNTNSSDQPEPDPYDPDSYRSTSTDTPGYVDGDEDEAAKPATPTKWWAGSRGRVLIYVAGAVFWIFIQSRN